MHYQNRQRKKFKIKFHVLLKFTRILPDCLAEMRKDIPFCVNLCCQESGNNVTAKMMFNQSILLDVSLTVKAAPHECVIRTSQL